MPLRALCQTRADLTGPGLNVVATLDALHAELGDPRYRVAPLLRQRAAVGASLAG